MNERPIVIATALPLERDAILAKLPSKDGGSADGFTLHQGLLQKYPVITICFQGMGNVRSARAMAVALEKFRPIAVVLVGIAGGTKKPTSGLFDKSSHFLGDVLVAEQVIDYELGKLSPKGMEQRPDVFRASARLLRIAKNLNDGDWKPQVRVDRPDGTNGRVVPNAHFGVVASGQKVLTSTSPLDAVSALFTNLVGVEMEGIGAAFAAHESTLGSVDFLLVKSICDWADPEKSDGWQPYAAHSAAAFALGVVNALISELVQRNKNIANRESNNQRIAKSEFVKRLGNSWEDLSDAFHIPVHEKRKFSRGNEPREIYEYLEIRNQLDVLPSALSQIGRDDLLEEPKENPS